MEFLRDLMYDVECKLRINFDAKSDPKAFRAFETRVIARTVLGRVNPADDSEIQLAAPTVPPIAQGDATSSALEAPAPVPDAQDGAASAAPGSSTDATSAQPAEPQFADDDPDSPYAIMDDSTGTTFLQIVDDMMMEGFRAQHWQRPFLEVPAAPTTPAAAAQLQSQMDQLVEQGRTHQAVPWQCQIALYSFAFLGPEHPNTLSTAYTILTTMFQCGRHAFTLCVWMLPRAAKQWGLGHPDTRRLVWSGARVLCEASDPRQHPLLTRTVTNVAKHLPGGLGWGLVKVKPVDEIYNKHAVLQKRAEAIMNDGEFVLAKQMLQRCVTYFESLGPHWLGSVRKIRSMIMIGACEGLIDGPTSAEAILLEAKKIAKKELGPEHKSTLQATWQYGENLLMMGRTEAAMSLFTKTLRVHRETLGPRNSAVFQSEIALAYVFQTAKRYKENEALLASVFERALLAMGPRDSITTESCTEYYEALLQLKGRRAAVAFKQRAAGLGCDVSKCVM